MGDTCVFNIAGSTYLELFPNKENAIIRLPFLGAGTGTISCVGAGIFLSLSSSAKLP